MNTQTGNRTSMNSVDSVRKDERTSINRSWATGHMQLHKITLADLKHNPALKLHVIDDA